VNQASDKRAAFTLQARFLKRKDELLQGTGITMTRIERTKVYNIPAVMSLYTKLKNVIQALDSNPNDRKAYQLGMRTLSSLKNLLDHFLPEREAALDRKVANLRVVPGRNG
jgi:hypothetical protein